MGHMHRQFSLWLQGENSKRTVRFCGLSNYLETEEVPISPHVQGSLIKEPRLGTPMFLNYCSEHQDLSQKIYCFASVNEQDIESLILEGWKIEKWQGSLIQSN